jgi:dinuclear metal center YbgI/SA1388 family protein
MQIQKIYDFLNELSPFELQESWDNSGLLVGSLSDEVDKIYISLDLESDFIDKIEPNSLVITHHPLIFKGLKKVNQTKYPSNILHKMIKKNISLISMHTNFDKTHLNRYVATKVLGYSDIKCEEFICYFDVQSDFESFALHVKQKLGLEVLRCTIAKDFVRNAALTTGSGGDLIGEVKADCFLSGDLKYHQALEAKENGLNLIDIGHFESESYFSACLGENLKNFPLKVIMSNSKNPFDYK